MSWNSTAIQAITVTTMLCVSVAAFAQTMVIQQPLQATQITPGTGQEIITQTPPVVIQQVPVQSVPVPTPTPTPVANKQPIQQLCRPYTNVLTIGDEKHVTRGNACLQQDGVSWNLQPSSPTEIKVEQPGICCSSE